MLLHHFLVVREDLPRGVSHAQLAHAAARSADGLHTEGTHVVVLAARDERELLTLESVLTQSDHYFVSIREPDLPWSNQLMAIGLRPLPRMALGRLLRRYPTLKERES